ncbi:uncharacterized protein PRCAT00004947001 [Priceomyces carsonii]|uniref:uncharacterized protein n=1 Tax=Priceomyces carsonii TaxID=28549 RepID=UPI002ED8E716|nr:unnamed protein product [Priceomyces carsonii]
MTDSEPTPEETVDTIPHRDPDMNSDSEAYDLSDRDQGEIDDEVEEKKLNEDDVKEEMEEEREEKSQEEAKKEELKQDYGIGSKRPLEDDESDNKEPQITKEEESLLQKMNKGDNESGNADVNDIENGETDGVQEEHGEESKAENEGEEEEEEEEEEDDDDEEEEDDDDDENDETVGRRKKKRRTANQFVDIEAEVDDEEEDELDEDNEEAELLREQFISDDRIDNEEGKDDEHQDDRLHRQFDRRRQEAEDQDAEKLAETLKQRYRRTHAVYRGDTAANDAVSQKLLMPSINDPSIYAIRCTPGREKELVRKLYEKKRTLARLNNPLDILTVFQRDAFKGYIYIEAKKPEAIDRALAGMVNIFARNRILVPVREYPDLLKQVKSSDVEIVPGIYIRITRGKYKNDLAIVDNLSENGLDVRCKLVPRLDYGKNDDFTKEGRRIKLKVKPIPRLFSEQEARMYDGDYLQPGRGPRSYIYRGEEYIDGFLFKDFKLQFIQTKDIHPTLEELDRFQSGNSEEDGLDLAAIAASLKNKNINDTNQSNIFQPGDNVEIRRGEQAKTVGKVLGASLNEVVILVTNSGDPKFVNQQLTVPASDLRKVFSTGDHVKIIEGKHSEETGLVMKIDGDSVVLLSDQTKEDVRVFANYLIKATDASLNIDNMNNNYDIKDLVELNASTVGVIVKAEKGLFEILTSDGRTLSVKPSGIASKLELSRREQIATDKNGSTIRVGDTVKEVLGDKKREGTIIHIFRSTLFIKLNEIIENLGIFATNCMNVSTITTKGSMVSKNLGPDLNKMNPNLKLPNPIAASGLKTRIGGRDKLIYKDVVITGGNHKGLMGKVTDADEVYARIELHTKSKKIKVNKNNLSVLVHGESIPYLRFIGAPMSQQSQQKFSAPAFTSGGRSSWNHNGGVTPAAGSGSSAWGSMGGASSWGGGKTPAYSSNGNASTWGGAASSWNGAKTPGNASSWGAGSTWGGNNGAGSTWGDKGNKSTWGNSSTWGSK